MQEGIRRYRILNPEEGSSAISILPKQLAYKPERIRENGSLRSPTGNAP